MRNLSVKEYTDNEILGLLGREPVERNLATLKGFYKGKVVLVTGGAGSIGTELVKLLVDLEASKVIVYDWWENGMFYLQHTIESKNVVYIIGDVKSKKLGKVMHRYKPEIVLHVSAYKHVPLMQDNPIEAFNNNVYGALNCMEMAIKHKVKNFVLVSTDKAVNPTNVMGATKRVCELLMERMEGSIFNAVRFGNVIQSNGSVVPIFLQQLREGKDLTVTHKNITRYFMTKREAAELILQSAIIAENGDIFLLDMGEPIKIYDLAQALIKDNRSKSKVVITGLRRGEKMSEELCYNDKIMDKTQEGKIFRIKKVVTGKKLEGIVRKTLEKSLNYEMEDANLIALLIKLGFTLQR